MQKRKKKRNKKLTSTEAARPTSVFVFAADDVLISGASVGDLVRAGRTRLSPCLGDLSSISRSFSFFFLPTVDPRARVWSLSNLSINENAAELASRSIRPTMKPLSTLHTIEIRAALMYF